MSTKIYNAYRFNGSLDELMVYLRDFRRKWLDLQIERFFEMTKDLDAEKRKEIMQKMEDDTRKRYNQWGDLDIKGDCVVYIHKGNIYVQFFIDTEPFRINVPVFVGEDDRFHDYHYQNQSDPWYWEMENDESKQEELKAAKQDWEERERVWDEIFSEESRPAACGLTFCFADVFDTYEIRNNVASKIRERAAQ